MLGLGWAREPEVPESALEDSVVRLGLGAGIGGAAPGPRFQLETVSGRLASVASLRFLVADQVILEPFYSYWSTVEEGVSWDTGVREEQVLTYSRHTFGLTLKPILLKRGNNALYPVASYGLRYENELEQTTEVDGDGRRLEMEESGYTEWLHGAQLGFGIQRWLDDSVTLSVDFHALTWARYSAETGDQSLGESEDFGGVYRGIDPSARMMLHVYW